MNAAQFKGVLAAVVTPFTSDGEKVDTHAIQRQADHILGNGVHGLVPGGSTGEFTAMTTAERMQANELYIEAAGGRGPVIAGTGALSTAETIELSRHAANSGAAAVMIVPPFYGAVTWSELLNHYSAVSDAVDIDIMYYNIPAASGIALTSEQLVELARRTRVSSFKDTGGDAVMFGAVLAEGARDIQAVSGFDTLAFSALASGATALVWGAASVAPALCAEFYDALAIREDLARARELWSVLLPICQHLEAYNYPAAVKAGVALVGSPAGPTRSPAQALAPESIRELRHLLAVAGVAGS